MRPRLPKAGRLSHTLVLLATGDLFPCEGTAVCCPPSPKHSQNIQKKGQCPAALPSSLHQRPNYPLVAWTPYKARETGPESLGRF